MVMGIVNHGLDILFIEVTQIRLQRFEQITGYKVGKEN
ncbi:hypothetical protein RintRC_5604 [Richelia intracellularis]|nr:hypothetical protein RintRC_5604 [Richelia intracellularis]